MESRDEKLRNEITSVIYKYSLANEHEKDVMVDKIFSAIKQEYSDKKYDYTYEQYTKYLKLSEVYREALEKIADVYA